MVPAFHAQGAKAGLSESWVAMIAAVKARMNQRRLYKRTVRELSALPDQKLKDLGLSRSMIRAVAKEAAKAA